MYLFICRLLYYLSFLFLLIWRIFGTPEACGRLIEFVSWEDVSPQLSDDLILLLESLEACTFQTRLQTNWSNAQILVTRHIWQNLSHKIRCSRVSPSIKGKSVKILFFLSKSCWRTRFSLMILALTHENGKCFLQWRQTYLYKYLLWGTL